MLRWFLILPLMVSGCVSAHQQIDTAHTVLDVITDVAQPIYSMAVQYCEIRQLVVLNTPDLSVAAKRAKIAKIRNFCKPVIDSFEKAVDAQKAARGILTMVEAGQAKIEDALDRINEVKEHISNGEQSFAKFKEKIQ